MPDYSVDSNKNIKSLSTWKNDNFGSGTYNNTGSIENTGTIKVDCGSDSDFFFGVLTPSRTSGAMPTYIRYQLPTKHGFAVLYLDGTIITGLITFENKSGFRTRQARIYNLTAGYFRTVESSDSETEQTERIYYVGADYSDAIENDASYTFQRTLVSSSDITLLAVW